MGVYSRSDFATEAGNTIQFFAKAAKEDSHTIIRAASNITQIFSTIVSGRIGLAVEVFGIYDVLDGALDVVSDITNITTTTSSWKLAKDSSALIGSAGGLALWIESAKMVNLAALVSLSLLTQITLISAVAFFAMNAVDAYSYRSAPLTEHDVTTIKDSIAKQLPNADMNEFNALNLVKSKDGMALCSQYSSVAKAALCASPLLGISIPYVALAAGLTSLYELSYKFAATSRVAGNIAKEQVWGRIKSSNDRIKILRNVQSTPPASFPSKLPEVFATFFREKTKPIMQGASSVCQFAELYVDTDLSGVKSAFSVDGFYSIIEVPGMIAKLLSLPGKKDAAAITQLLNIVEAALSVATTSIGAVKWYNSALLTEFTKKYVKTYALIGSLVLGILRNQGYKACVDMELLWTHGYKALGKSGKLEMVDGVKLLKSCSLIALQLIRVTQLPILDYLPTKLEDALKKALLGVGVLMANFIEHMHAQYAVHLKEDDAYAVAAKKDPLNVAE